MTSLPISRRRLLKGVAAAACANAVQSLIPGAALASAIARQPERRNIDSMSPSELAAYEHAVGLLRGSGAGSHPALAHPALRDVNAPNSRSISMPWDAEYLTEFEHELRAANPARNAEITVPYWDFTRPPSGREYPRAFERVGSPLYVGRDGETRSLDIVLWSYHAYIDHVRTEWQRARGPLAQNERAHVWIGSNTVEIRIGKSA